LTACILLNKEQNPISAIFNRRYYVQFELWLNVSKRAFCYFSSTVWTSLVQSFFITSSTSKMTTIVANRCTNTSCLITKAAHKIRSRSKSFRTIGLLRRLLVRSVFDCYERFLWQQD
jgi:hypothetical protein